jgi:periplasmic divalent cation tolerance protein
VVLSTAPPTAAAAIARALVRARVAACVNIVPGVRSVYRWRGRIEEGKEALLVVKTTKRALVRCLRALAAAHPYEVPEGLVLPPTHALLAYGRWIRRTLDVHRIERSRRSR